MAGQAANGGSAQELTVNLKGHVGVSLNHGHANWEEKNGNPGKAADAQDGDYYAGEEYTGGDMGIHALDARSEPSKSASSSDAGLNALDEAPSSSPAGSLHTFSGGSHGKSANASEEEEEEEEEDG